MVKEKEEEELVLSKQEKYLIKLLREFRPFERIEIAKGADGKPNSYLVQRSQKIMVSEITITAVR